MGKIYWSSPPGLIAQLVDGLDLRVAVETGTYQGETTEMLSTLVDRVWSVEAEASLAAAAQGRFASDNVTVLAGDSGTLLPKVLAQIDEPALFWLDAHWFDDLPQVTATQCPILDELEAIGMFAHRTASCVLIDDSHMFTAAVPAPNNQDDWPTYDEVVRRLGFAEHLDIVADVIVAGPVAVRELVVEWGRGVSNGRSTS
jgi:hypothetical protein